MIKKIVNVIVGSHCQLYMRFMNELAISHSCSGKNFGCGHCCLSALLLYSIIPQKVLLKIDFVYRKIELVVDNVDKWLKSYTKHWCTNCQRLLLLWLNYNLDLKPFLAIGSVFPLPLLAPADTKVSLPCRTALNCIFWGTCIAPVTATQYKRIHSMVKNSFWCIIVR